MVGKETRKKFSISVQGPNGSSSHTFLGHQLSPDTQEGLSLLLNHPDELRAIVETYRLVCVICDGYFYSMSKPVRQTCSKMQCMMEYMKTHAKCPAVTSEVE